MAGGIAKYSVERDSGPGENGSARWVKRHSEGGKPLLRMDGYRHQTLNWWCMERIIELLITVYQPPGRVRETYTVSWGVY